MTNPILEAREREFLRRCSPDMLGGYEQGWDVAMDTTRPIIEAAIATWRIIASGTPDGVSVAGLGGAGTNALTAAENWIAALS